MDIAGELVGQKGLTPQQLVDWISDKRGKLCCIYMKYDQDKTSPNWNPYRYQVLKLFKNYLKTVQF